MFLSYRVRIPVAIVLASAGMALAGAVQVSAATTPPFTCTNKSGGHSNARGTIFAIRASHHEGFDRLVFAFPTTNALPPFRLTRQSSSTFIQDPSGMPTTLEGTAGIRVVFQNADIAPGVPNDLKPRLPEIREVKKVGDFERVVSYGVGLSRPSCFRAFELSGPGGGPTRLVIDVATHATAPSAAASTVTLAQTGHPAGPSSQGAAWPVMALVVGFGAVAASARVLGRALLVRRSS